MARKARGIQHRRQRSGWATDDRPLDHRRSKPILAPRASVLRACWTRVSLTLRTGSAAVDYPAVRQRLVTGGLVSLIAVTIVMLGLVAGGALRDQGFRALAPGGSLFQVQLSGGAVYVGDLVNESDDLLTLGAPAVVLQDSSQGSQTTYRVVPLSAEPHSLAGSVLIPRNQVMIVGVVAAGSPIERAYLDAMTHTGPTPSPS